jgi:protoporphyrinogen oxidase
VYFPERDFLVNRISFPKTFSPHNAPAGHYSIQAEITCARDAEEWKWSDTKIINHVIDGLVKKNIISSKKDVTYCNLKRHPYAYVVYDRDYEKNVKTIRDWFPKQGIYLVGRFSYFEYINVDGVIKTSLKIASEINDEEVAISDEGRLLK